MLTKNQEIELEKRINHYESGRSKTYSWKEIKKLLTSHRNKTKSHKAGK
jgi:putative addiction module component (TIGR02574 family)